MYQQFLVEGMQSQHYHLIANHQPACNSHSTWKSKRSVSGFLDNIEWQWKHCKCNQCDDYLRLQLGKRQDVQLGQSIYWEPLWLGQSNTSKLKRSSEQPDKHQKYIHKVRSSTTTFYIHSNWTPVTLNYLDVWNEEVDLPAVDKRQCWQPISFWPVVQSLMSLSRGENNFFTCLIMHLCLLVNRQLCLKWEVGQWLTRLMVWGKEWTKTMT